MPKESSELYNNYCKTNSYKTVEEFVNSAPPQILLQGTTITLQTDVENINLDNLYQIELFLNEKLQHAEKTENEDKKEQSKTNQKNAQNKQIVPVTGLFGYNLTSSKKQVMRVPIVVAAMRDNFFWFGSIFFSAIQFF